MIDKNKLLEIEMQLELANKELIKEQLLLTRTANVCLQDAKKQPPMKELLGTLWQTGEIVILCGDTGTGKSIFGVACGEAITKGKSINLGLNVEMSAPVLYIDFELSDIQFNNRYTNHTFADSLYRTVYNPRFIGDYSLCVKDIIESIKNTSAQILILDNITALSLKSTEDANVAIEIMRFLKCLALEGYSIMVMAHVPKIPSNRPLVTNFLAGSKLIANFADSILFLSQSSEGRNVRYLKQTKCRNAEQMEGVMVLELCRENEFLGFTFLKYDKENNHIGSDIGSYDEKMTEAIQLQQKGMVYRDIAEIVGIPLATLGRKLKAVKDSKIQPYDGSMLLTNENTGTKPEINGNTPKLDSG